MTLILTLLVGVVLAVVVYQILRRAILQRVSRRSRINAQAQVDAAMEKVLHQLQSGTLAHRVGKTIQSQPVADVWGRGVMTFEYQFQAAGMVSDDLPEVKKVVNQALKEYATEHHLKSVVSGQTALLVTDLWLLQAQLHLEVTYVINRPTVEYLADLARLKKG